MAFTVQGDGEPAGGIDTTLGDSTGERNRDSFLPQSGEISSTERKTCRHRMQASAGRGRGALLFAGKTAADAQNRLRVLIAAPAYCGVSAVSGATGWPRLRGFSPPRSFWLSG